MKDIGILGIAKSGLAAALKARLLGYNVFVSEQKERSSLNISDEVIANLNCEFGGHTERIFSCDTVIVSPGIPLTAPIISKLRDKSIELISEIEFGYRIKHKESKIIAVTGSNGKSTTVTLINHILTQLGYKTALAGNIGTAFTSLPIEKIGYDFIILELSSFQLDLVDTFKADIALLLNITPDHLNRYDSFDHYSLAKFNIFNNQTENDSAIIFQDDLQIAKYKQRIKSSIKSFSLHRNSGDSYLADNLIISKSRTINVSNFKLKGEHNYQNIMASMLTLDCLNIAPTNIEEIIGNFTGLEHRLELVLVKNGVQFINDSKATNTDSVKYALSAFGTKVRIILGGSDKGEDFSVLLPHLQKFAQKIYLIGATKKKMLKQLDSFESIEEFETLNECITKAYNDSQSGDIILLSPACASYDMFKNFEHRGDCFKKIAQEIT